MKKIITLSFTLLFIIFKSNAQTQILPDGTNEFCPNTNISFSVTVPGTVTSIVPQAGGCSVISQSANNFIGSFNDANTKQTFRANYKTSSGVLDFKDFDFTKIKSLFFNKPSLTTTVISPNILSINAPRCQITNYSISFSNVQYFTEFETPDLIFGSVATYEYLLPVGWKLNNGSPSNGTIWLPANNNVTLTSDLNNGDLGSIQIRAVNPCSQDFKKGAIKSILISRPKPSAITGGVPLLCSGSSTYTLNVIPVGSSISWSLSAGTTVASIPPGSTGNSVVVTRVGNGNANTTLTANISACGITYPPINYAIAVGVPGVITLQVDEIAFDFCNTSLMQFNATLQNPAPGTQLNWSVIGSGAFIKFGAGGYTPVLNIKRTGSFELMGTITNSCGSSTYSAGIFYGADFYSNYCGATFNKFSVSPNPVKEKINVVFENQTKSTDIINIRLYSLNSSMIVRQWAVKGGQTKFSLNTSNLKNGIYTLKILSGNSKVSKQIIVE